MIQTGLHRGTPLDTVGRRGTPWDAVGHRGTPSDTVGRRGTPWDAAGHRGTPWDTVGRRGTTWDNVGQRGTTWDNVGQRGTTWDTVGHRGICLVSQIHSEPILYNGTLSDLESSIKIDSFFALNLVVILCTGVRCVSPLILWKDRELTNSRRDFSFIICLFGLLLSFPFLRENYCGPVRVYNFSIYSKVLSRENRTLNSLEQ